MLGLPGNIGGEEGATREAKEATASILKDLLKQNPSTEVQEVILRSAVKIGGEWGTSVVIDLFEIALTKKMIEKDLPPEVQEAFAEVAGQRNKTEEEMRANFLAGLLNNMDSLSKHMHDFIAVASPESLRKIEIELKAVILKALLKKNPISQVQKVIAESAGKLGEEAEAKEAGVSVLKALLKQDSSPEVQMVILKSAVKIGGEWGTSVVKDMFEDLFKGVLKALLEIDMSSELQAAFANLAGENKPREELIASVFENLEKALSPQERDVILKYVKKMERELIASVFVNLEASVFVNLEKALSPQELGFILESLRKIEEELKAVVLKELLKKNPEPYVQKIIAKSAGKIGGEEASAEAKEAGASVLKALLEMGIPLELEVQEAIAYSAGELGPAGAGVLKKLLKKNPKPHVQEIIAQSAGKIGGEEGATREAKEAGASVLKDLLEMDIPFELGVQVAIAQSAGKLGPAGAGVLKYMLEKNPKPYVQEFIAQSAGKIGAEARKAEAGREEAEAREVAVSILKDLLKRKSLSDFVKKAIAYSAGEIGGEEGAGILKDMYLLKDGLIFAVQMAINRSAQRIEEETGITIL